MAVMIFVVVLVLVLVAFVVVAYLVKQNPDAVKAKPKQQVVEGHEIRKRTWIKNWDGTAVAYTACECGWNKQGRDPSALDLLIRDHLRDEQRKLERREYNERLIEEGKDKDIAW